MVQTEFILTDETIIYESNTTIVNNKIVIPKEVTKNNLQKLIVGSNVTYIAASQFEGYTELTTLNLQNASTLVTINQKAFFNCDKLMSVADYDEDAIVYNIDDIIVIPETVTHIGKDAFTVQIDDLKINKNLYIRGTKKYQKYLTDTTKLTWLGRENNYFFMDEFKYNGYVNSQFNSAFASFSSTFSKTPYFPPNMLAKVKDDEIPFTIKIVNSIANLKSNPNYPLNWRLHIFVRTNGIGNGITYSLKDYEEGKNVILVNKDGTYGDFKGSLVRFYNSDGILQYNTLRDFQGSDVFSGPAIFKKSENGRSAELQGYFNTQFVSNLPNDVNNYEITIKAELFNKTKEGKILFKNNSRHPYGYNPVATIVAVCFPGNSQLILKDGTKKLFHDVQYGDEVQVCSKEMELSYSKVTFLPHLQNDQLTAFIKFITESNQTIRVTSKHLLPILNKNNTLQNIMAEDITKEDKLYVLNNGQGMPEAIKSIERIVEEGAYTAYIQNGEYLVVDNVVASPYAMNHNLFNILNKIINGLDNVGLMVVISPVIRILEGILYGAFKGLGLMRYIEDKR